MTNDCLRIRSHFVFPCDEELRGSKQRPEKEMVGQGHGILSAQCEYSDRGGDSRIGQGDTGTGQGDTATGQSLTNFI